MGATSQQPELFNDYEGFVEKFKPKKTTDDCYTPQPIYDVILDYVVDRYGIDPAGALYIDDAEANIRAGAELGLRVWHYFGEDRGA